MNRRFRRIRSIAAAAVLAAALAFVAPAASYTVLAATGTVTGDNINVRETASTDGSVVGTVSSGDSVTVGETTTDDSGATWYQVTLSDGTSGYIRGDFLTVTEDDTSDTETTESTEDTTETTDESTDEAVTDATAAADQDTGGYQIVLAPDEDGNETYYLYDNNAGERMKISDISLLQEEVNTANQAAANTKTQYTVYLIVLIVAVVILLIAVIVLVLKLRDALANGRRERDLTMERRDQRKNNRNADSVEALRKRGGRETQTRSGRGRDDAYASGASRRVERDDSGAPYGTRTDPRRPASSESSDPYAGTASRTRSAGAAREGGRQARATDARPQAYSGDGQVRRTGGTGQAQGTAAAQRRPAAGTAAQGTRTSASGYEQGTQRRSISSDGSVQGQRRPAASSGAAAGSTGTAQRRPAATTGEAQETQRRSTARPASEGSSYAGTGTAQRGASSPETSSGRTAQARNFADDDFDFNFLNLDDSDE